MDHAEHEFGLAKKDSNGVSQREHLKIVERSIGKRPAELESPELPVHLAELWYSFLHLCTGRRSGYNGPESLSFSEIKAWCELTQNELEPHELDIFKSLDSLFLKVANV